MQKHTKLLALPLLAAAPVAMASASASAEPVRIEFESADELSGWEHIHDSSEAIFNSDGTLTIRSEHGGYNEFMLWRGGPSSAWWDQTSSCGPWWVEARVRVVSGDSGCNGGPGVWIHDGGRLIKMHFTPDQALIGYPRQINAPLDATDDFHTYRLQSYRDGRVQLLIDGQVAIEEHRLDGGAGSEVLTFGNLGGCGGSEVIWDAFAYDARPSLVSDDTDGDGIPDDVDNCFDKPNTDQDNPDNDCMGSACDPCPLDANGDSDQDGACDSDDPCPTDPNDADTDADGVCDVDEFNECWGPDPGGDGCHPDDVFDDPTDPTDPTDPDRSQPPPLDEDDTTDHADRDNSDPPNDDGVFNADSTDGGASTGSSGGCSTTAAHTTPIGALLLLALLTLIRPRRRS